MLINPVILLKNCFQFKNILQLSYLGARSKLKECIRELSKHWDNKRGYFAKYKLNYRGEINKSAGLLKDNPRLSLKLKINQVQNQINLFK